MSDSFTLHLNKFNPHANVDEEKLCAFIKEKGFENMNIRQSKTTDESCYIHVDVQFENEETCMKALKELRYTNSEISRELRVTRFHSHIGASAAFVAKLDNKVTSAEFHNALEEIVPSLPVVFVHVPLRKDEPLNKGFAIVMFGSDAAVKEFADLETKQPEAHKQLVAKIGDYQFSEYRSETEMLNHFTRVYVNNLPASFTIEKVVELCQKYDCEVLPADKDDSPTMSITSHKFKNEEIAQWGVIGFVDHETAVKFIEAVNGEEIEGRKIMACRYASPKTLMKQRQTRYAQQKREINQKYVDCNLVVHNIPVGTNNAMLVEIFGAFGEIARSGVPASKVREYEGRQCPQGFVQYTTSEAAQAAVAAIHDKDVSSFPILAPLVGENEEDKKLSVVFVKRSEERNAQVAKRGAWAETPTAEDEFTVYENSNEEERREILGNKLYPRIEDILNHDEKFRTIMEKENLPVDEACSMITGMLIALDWTPEKLPLFEELLSNYTNLSAQIDSGLNLIILENQKVQ